jgi:hypothetical protein
LKALATNGTVWLGRELEFWPLRGRTNTSTQLPSGARTARPACSTGPNMVEKGVCAGAVPEWRAGEPITWSTWILHAQEGVGAEAGETRGLGRGLAGASTRGVYQPNDGRRWEERRGAGEAAWPVIAVTVSDTMLTIGGSHLDIGSSTTPCGRGREEEGRVPTCDER